MQRDYVISIMTRDRVGIIADVTAAIRQLHGNLGDLSQTVLQDHFSMIVLASFPEDVTEEQIRETLLKLDPAAPFELGIRVRTNAPAEIPAHQPRNRYVLTASGPDQLGFVAKLAEHLRQKQINIEDVVTNTENNRYTMILLLNLAPDTDVAKLKRSLQIVMDDLGATCELQHHGIFRATNEI